MSILSFKFLYIREILFNQASYSPHPPLYLSLRHICRRVVEIRDQGIGIPQEEVELIFQSFYRASNTRSYKGQGIGPVSYTHLAQWQA